MGAEAVTVEASDMSPLVQNKIMRVAMENNFSAIADSLTMLQPDELFDSLESSALKVFTAQPTQITSPDSRWVREQQEKQSLQALQQAGVRDPLEAWNKRDEAKARQEAEYKQSQQKDLSDFYDSADEATHQELTLQEQVRFAKEKAMREEYGF
jgi:hypothetical protein